MVGPGESFWIGQTRFTLHSDGEAEPVNPVDATVAPRQEEKTRAQLEEIPFANPAAALRAMEQLPSTIRAVTTEQGLFRQMLKVVMDAMPFCTATLLARTSEPSLKVTVPAGVPVAADTVAVSVTGWKALPESGVTSRTVVVARAGTAVTVTVAGAEVEPLRSASPA